MPNTLTLTTGTRLGPYEITAAIGAGGMGEVYRARDTKLNRDVAIKVLPAAFADDPERLSRFTREARTLASLNHPNIATIHGIEEIPGASGSGPGSRALVMELIDGEDLSAVIARGPIPIAEALPIARQIAEALEAAHEQSIVHRDLKPANIKVRPDGTVKVLDFGLAKAMDPAGASSSNPNVSHSPTLTHQGTSAGMIMGTAAYMSPEQARGRPVDKRADIWAFGVVLYEMLSGKRAFKGDDVSETLASVLKDTLSMDALPASTPPRLKRLLGRCLDRDLKTRLRDIGEARVKIARIESGADESATSAPALAAAASAPAWRQALPWAGGAILGGALGSALLMGNPQSPPRDAPTPVRLSVEIGADAWLDIGDQGSGSSAYGSAAIISPDGSLLAFTARQTPGQPTRLYVRRLEQLEASPLSGTEDARNAFFSPDSQWLAFFASSKLKKVKVTGGAVVTLCDAPTSRGGTWNEDGTISFNAGGATRAGLLNVPAAGGTPVALTEPDPAEGEVSDRWPQALPGGKGVLFTAGLAGDFEGASLVVQPAARGPRKVLVRGGYHGRYVRSGHIIYIHEGTLFAVPFDLDRLEILGPPAPVIEGIATSANNAGAQFSVSDTGTLLFLPGRGPGAVLPIQWLEKGGKLAPLRAVPGKYRNITFSPDGNRLAMDLREGGGSDIWIYDWVRDTMSRLTFDQGDDSEPVWTPDGQRIVFTSTRAGAGASNLYWQRADGSGEVQRLTESPNRQFPGSWDRGGRFLSFSERSASTGWDVMILELEGSEASGWKPGKTSAFLNSPVGELEAVFSPDGHWVAYLSNESGETQVYVRPFPGPGGKWQISTTGGTDVMWSHKRHELFYRNPEFRLMVAPWTASADTFRAEKPQEWSHVPVPQPGPGVGTVDLHPEGERFAVVKAADEHNEKRDKVVLIENFFEELRRVAPPGKR